MIFSLLLVIGGAALGFLGRDKMEDVWFALTDKVRDFVATWFKF